MQLNMAYMIWKVDLLYFEWV